MQAYISRQENLHEQQILNDYAINGSDYLSDESMTRRRSVFKKSLIVRDNPNDDVFKKYIKERKKFKNRI